MSNSNSDHKKILFHLIEKIWKNGEYYRKIADGNERKASRLTHPVMKAEFTARAESLRRCAEDMNYTFERAVSFLTEAEAEEITSRLKPDTTEEAPPPAGSVARKLFDLGTGAVAFPA